MALGVKATIADLEMVGALLITLTKCSNVLLLSFRINHETRIWPSLLQTAKVIESNKEKKKKFVFVQILAQPVFHIRESEV